MEFISVILIIPTILLCFSLRFSYHLQVTILVAAEGVYKLPVINSSSDLKAALQKLGSIPSSKTLVYCPFLKHSRLFKVKEFCFCTICFQAVEVLWTPQNENDTLSERELLEDYPLLRPL